MNEISVKAPAKLNLHLQVISKRSDEFHELRTLFTYIDLFDDLFFKITDEKVELKETEPINDNLVLKAADILKSIYSSLEEGRSLDGNDIIDFVLRSLK